jgi:hypothetical protein
MYDYMKELDEDTINYLGENLRSKGYNEEKNLWSKMLYPEFWDVDVVDGLEYLYSVGATAKGLNLVGKGLSLGQSAVVPSLIKNTLNTTAIGMSFASIEAKDVYETIQQDLKGKVDPKTGQVYTNDRINEIAKIHAGSTFRANLLPAMLAGNFNLRWMGGLAGFDKASQSIKNAVRSGKLTAENASKYLSLNEYKSLLGSIGKGASVEMAQEGWEFSVNNWETYLASNGLTDENRSFVDEMYGPGYVWLNGMKAVGKGFLGQDLTKDEMGFAHASIIGGILGGGGEFKATRQENLNKLLEAGIEIESYKQLSKELDIVDKAFTDNVKSIYKQYVDKEGKATLINPETGEIEVDVEAARKLAFQALQEKRLYDSSLDAALTGDRNMATLNAEMSTATAIFRYLSQTGSKEIGF